MFKILKSFVLSMFLLSCLPNAVDGQIIDSLPWFKTEVNPVVEDFFRSIKTDDESLFNSVFEPNDVNTQVWTDMRPLSLYRKLPGYVTHSIQFEQVFPISFEPCVDCATEEGFIIIVTYPSLSVKAWSRGPSDILHPVTANFFLTGQYFNALVLGDRNVKSINKGDMTTKSSPSLTLIEFLDLYHNSIVLGESDMRGVKSSENTNGIAVEPTTWAHKLIGKDKDPSKYITVVVKKNPKTKKFNIVMPDLELLPYYDEQWGKALKAFRNNKFQVAQKGFQKFLTQYPDSGTGHYMLGWSYLKNKDHKSAAGEFQKIVAEYPNSGSGHYMLGLSLEQFESQGEAHVHFQKAYDLNPNDLSIKVALGRSHYKMKQYEESVAILKTVDTSKLTDKQKAKVEKMLNKANNR